MQTTFETREKIYTIEEYLEMEEHSKEKHEFYNGKISLMPGGTFTHNQVAANVSFALIEALYEEDYIVCNSDMKIHIPRIQTVVYPDAVVVFQKPELYNGRADVIMNPLLVVEVASPSTSRYDRIGKFEHYKSLSSFKEYVIVEQNSPWVLASYKTADKTWIDTEAEGLDQSIQLQSINCSIALKKIYRLVKF